MSSAVIALVIGLAATGWSYPKLAKYTGNATPRNNYIAAGGAGLLIFIIAFTVLKFIVHF